MEPPNSFAADDIRNEKAKILKAIRVYSQEEALNNTVRGQYDEGKKADGTPCPAYRQEKDVNPKSNTETYAAVKLQICNWRWEGVPMYLRSGKALWKRGTEIVVQFKKAPEVIFRGTAVQRFAPNRLIFHIQPDEAVESIIQAKIPGPTLHLQPVNMRFSYGESFTGSPGTGYEVMLYSCMIGDPTLFSRSDLVEMSWRIAQPLLDAWAAHPPTDFPNYAAGSWGPVAASRLIERDGRTWFEVINRDILQRVPLFKNGDPRLLTQVSMELTPRTAAAGEDIVKLGDPGSEMYLISRGEADAVDAKGKVINTMRDGDCFGELALLLSSPRLATVRAKTTCDLFVLDKADFSRILREHPHFADALLKIARERYNMALATEQLLASR
jgi:glucose-6-phosphate 1-dehydrogenase